MNDLNLCWLMATLCCIAVSENIIQLSEASDDDIKRPLSPHTPAFKAGE